MMRKSVFFAACSSIALSLSGPALAQGAATEQSADATIAEIVVTAQKRSERIQDVPIAITAVSGDSLAERGITDPKGLAKAVPGLNVATTSGYGGKLNYTLRGVGLNTYSSVQEPAVAVYQDEVYVASSDGAQFSLFDIDRVEVLRGPQGSLFGRSASGGLVNYISREPGRNNEGSLTLGVGTYGERIVEAAQDLSLDETGDNALRGSFRYNGSDGFVHNRAGGKNLEGGDLFAGRAQLRLQPAGGLRILLKGEYGQFDSDYATGYRPFPSYADNTGLPQLVGRNQNIYGTPGGDLFGYRDTSSDFWSTNSANPSFLHTKRSMVSGRIDWDLGGATLTSLSAYLHGSGRGLEDTDGSPTNFVTYASNLKTDEYQQEIRLSSDASSPIKWTVGAFYFDYRVRANALAQLPIGVPPLGVTDPISFSTAADQKRHSFAGFGQVEVPFGEKLSVTFGGRIERESATFNYAQAYNPLALTTAILGSPPVTFSTASDGDLARIRKTYYSGGITINYKPDDRILLYTSLKRGIKPGGFSTPLSGIPATDFKFNEEKLDALEAGIKSDWLDGTLRVNASAFHYWYNDYQAVQFRNTRVVTGNTDARVSGIDLEAIFAPVRALELGASGGYADAVAENIPLRGVARDRRMPNAPKLSMNAYLQYRMDVLGGDLSLRLDEIYRSKTFFEIQNSPALAQDAYNVEDVSATWKKDGWSVTAEVSNVLSRKYFAFVQDLTDFGFIQATPAKPRTFSLRVAKSW